jgi:hypothetical protein
MVSRLFIVCTPRTGNTWLRKLLVSALDLAEYAVHSVDEIPWQSLPARCVISMHLRETAAFRQFLDGLGFREIVTVRHPLDVLISILQFSQNDPTTFRWVGAEDGDERSLMGSTPTSPAFLRYCLGPRAAALLGVSPQWMPYAAGIVRYESLVAAPEVTLAALVDRLGLRPARPLAQVTDEHTIDKLRAGISQHHFWQGRPGLWKRLLTMDIVAPIFERHRAVFDLLGYSADYDPRLTRRQARNNWRTLFQPESERSWIDRLRLPRFGKRSE